MATRRLLSELGIPPDGLGIERGDTRNHLQHRGRIYKPGSEIELDDRRIKILGKLGKGAFGTAFLVMDWDTRQLFTLKSFSGLSNYEREDIVRAIRTLQEHPLPDGTLQQFVGTKLSADDLLLYSYVAGTDLSKYIEKDARIGNVDSMLNAITYVRRLIENWGILSRNGLVHRDISLNNAMPSGTFIDPDCIASLHEVQDEAPINQTWYLAPEACANEIHKTSDLYSIAVIGATFILGGVPQGENAKLCLPGMRGWESTAGNTRERLLNRRMRFGFKGTGYWETVSTAPQWECYASQKPIIGRFVHMLDQILEYEPSKRPQTAEACLDLLKE